MKIVSIMIFLVFAIFFNACSSGNATGISTVTQRKSDDAERHAVTEQKAERKSLTPAAYTAWVENKKNGLKVEKTISDFTYTLQYKPLEYVALLELRKQQVTQAELAKTVDDFSGLQYFTLQITTDSQDELLKKNLTEKNEYYGRIQYFSFDMQKDLKLIDGKDTLNCELFHFERIYGIAPYARFVLGFPKTNGYNDKTLFYDEKIFGSGKIYLTVQAKNNNQLPAVITTEYETK